MTKIILIGPPGAGKGTQSEKISEKYELPCISTGQILREHVQNKTELGQEASSYIEKGDLVPDELIMRLIHTRLDEKDCEKGYILDGFPRTIAQAQEIASSHIEISGVLFFNVQDQVIIERLSGRWVHQSSGRVYHEKFNPPKQEGLDDVTGEPLSQRKDDTKESIARRLESFREDTAPVIDYYKRKSDFSDTKFIEIDGDRSLDSVFADITTFIDSLA